MIQNNKRKKSLEHAPVAMRNDWGILVLDDLYKFVDCGMV